jgi:cytochrome c oxidase assembly protein subunit 15
MVVIGGITRLTGSGLSMTDWDLLMGAIPPLDESEWNQTFDRYKQIPEYKLINSHMDLAGFKKIFFWEFLHRNWGRMMGLVFFFPFIWFWRRGYFSPWLIKRGLLIMLAGGAVGGLGWFMVKSGLSDRPDVSQYRLAIHLCAAFSVFSLVLWTWLDLKSGRKAWRSDITSSRWVKLALALLLLQIVWGAFTAGLDAGRVYNTWPDMNGEFYPSSAYSEGSFVQATADSKGVVQFIHRTFAWIVASVFITIGWDMRKEKSMERTWRWWIIGVLIQFSLGVMAIMYQVPIVIGVLHQLGALLLLAVVVTSVHAFGRPIRST